MHFAQLSRNRNLYVHSTPGGGRQGHGSAGGRRRPAAQQSRPGAHGGQPPSSGLQGIESATGKGIAGLLIELLEQSAAPARMTPPKPKG